MIKKEITATGKDISQAKENAVIALGVAAEEDVQFEILDLGTKGIFGIGARPAKVRAYIEGDDIAFVRGDDISSEHEPAEKSERGERSEKSGRGRQRNHRRGNRSGRGDGNRDRESSARRRAEMEEAAREGRAKGSQMKSVVIPEAELTFTAIEAAEGDYPSLDFVNTLLKNLGLEGTATISNASDGTLRITVTGEEASLLIGHHGDTLDSLQYLANLAEAQKKSGNKSRVTIDIEGYRAKREETLRALARRRAEIALTKNKSVMLEPMSAYERRIIHSEVQKIDGVATNSIGSDNNRKIVIYLTDKKNTEAEPLTEAETEAEAEAEVPELEIEVVTEETSSSGESDV